MSPDLRRNLSLILIFCIICGYYFIFERSVKKTETDEKLINNVELKDIHKFKFKKGNTIIVGERANGEWQIFGPEKKKGNKENIEDLLKSLLFAFLIEKIRENPRELSEFGLDKPQMEISIWTNKGNIPITVLIGDANPVGTCVYAIIKGSNSVARTGSLLHFDWNKSPEWFVRK
ncbi:MAG: DUF4340 domain-containing protein [Thermodesulfobacteriota bacterium]|nr:DUF4340 domain-containing protein [Thermodesulfobacteriota bacterium]